MNPANADSSRPSAGNVHTVQCFYLINGLWCFWAELCIETEFMEWNLIYAHRNGIMLTCIAHTDSRLFTQKMRSLSQTM